MIVEVDPALARRAIGSALLAELIAHVGEEASITLEVRMSNDAAVALYEGFAFVSAGVRPRYYQDNGEDALIMWRGRQVLGSWGSRPAATTRAQRPSPPTAR